MSRKRKYAKVRELEFPIDNLQKEIMEFLDNNIDIVHIIATYTKPRITSFSAFHKRRAFVFDNGNAIFHHKGVHKCGDVRDVSVSRSSINYVDIHNVPRSLDENFSIPEGTILTVLDDITSRFFFLTQDGLVDQVGSVLDLGNVKGSVLSISGDFQCGKLVTTDAVYTISDEKVSLVDGVTDLKWFYNHFAYLYKNGTVSVQSTGTGGIRRRVNIDRVCKIDLAYNFLLIITQDLTLWAEDTEGEDRFMISENVTDFTASWQHILFLTNGDYWCFDLERRTSSPVH